MRSLVRGLAPLFVPRAVFWGAIILATLLCSTAAEDSLDAALLGIGMGAGFALGNRVGSDITRGTAEYLCQLPLAAGRAHRTAQLYGFASLTLIVVITLLVAYTDADRWILGRGLGLLDQRVDHGHHAGPFLFNLAAHPAFAYWTAVTVRLRFAAWIRIAGWGWEFAQTAACVAVPMLHLAVLSRGFGEPFAVAWLVYTGPTVVLLPLTLFLAWNSLALARKLGPEAWPMEEST